MNRCAVVLVLAACSRRTPIASCEDDLRGVYSVDPLRADGTDQQWMILDHGATLEAYPLFPDGAGPTAGSAGVASALEVAPRRIELTRRTSAIEGTLHRRYMRRAELCDAQVPVHVTRCSGDALELVLADPAPPIGFAPCAWPGPGPSRVARWRRE